MIQSVELHAVDKNGNPIAGNTSLAIEYIFSDWAGDLEIKDDELLNRLSYLTPKKGIKVRDGLHERAIIQDLENEDPYGDDKELFNPEKRV